MRSYHPGMDIFHCQQWDNEETVSSELQRALSQLAWLCPTCTLRNSIQALTCNGCNMDKPPEHQIQIAFFNDQVQPAHLIPVKKTTGLGQ